MSIADEITETKEKFINDMLEKEINNLVVKPE